MTKTISGNTLLLLVVVVSAKALKSRDVNFIITINNNKNKINNDTINNNKITTNSNIVHQKIALLICNQT